MWQQGGTEAMRGAVGLRLGGRGYSGWGTQRWDPGVPWLGGRQRAQRGAGALQLGRRDTMVRAVGSTGTRAGLQGYSGQGGTG